jgi:hypothetical protein
MQTDRCLSISTAVELLKRLYRGPKVVLLLQWSYASSLCSAVTHIEVEVMRPCAGSLLLSYLVTGRISDLRIPPAVAATRTDELWRHTCFEAFICNSLGPAYYEFNFAPSTQWAAYWFDSYRSGMRVATEISAPRIKVRSSRACYRLQASLEMSQMSSLRIDGAWRIGLAAVIEEMGGHQSYWALAHPPGKADFHQSDSFALEFS